MTLSVDAQVTSCHLERASEVYKLTLIALMEHLIRLIAKNRENEAGMVIQRVATIVFLSLLIGVVAGLVGVGGGEFRIPVLLHVAKLSAKIAIAVNLAVGLLTVTASLLRRLQITSLSGSHAGLITLMSLASIFGAYVGALLTNRIPEKPLRRALALLLVIVGLKIVSEAFVESSATFSFTLGLHEELVLAVLVGLAIGIISGFLGVAGGEFRIPALIYIFGFDVVEAGTVSLIISIPTVASGFLTHHRMKHISEEAKTVVAIMGVCSIIGAVIGASCVGIVEKHVLKTILGIVLILAAMQMTFKP